MNPSHQVLVGDCIDMMRTLPGQSVQCCVTSPPYFGLRDYGVDGQIGLEQTPADFVARLVEVFREVRRVLRDDGTAWVNMGDSYANGGRTTRDTDDKLPARGMGFRPKDPDGIKPKDLMGMPWRLAFALQDDGWYLRQDIIWSKPNPMPESTRDRCTKSHEYIFLLSKSRRYHCDMDAIREPAIYGVTPTGVGFGHGFDEIVKPRAQRDSFQRNGSKREQTIPGQSKGTHRPDREQSNWDVLTRNKRSVWTVATHSFKGAHFATFPPDLIRPCVLAGAPRGGVVLDPFGGAGTTAVVAMQEGRKSVLCELNPDYAVMAERRIAAAWLDGAAQMDVFHDAAPAA
jgi:site-specific DNA-methyltransferase (adenine-specific)